MSGKQVLIKSCKSFVEMSALQPVSTLQQVQEELVLRLSAPPVEPNERPHVTWAADVVDNEHMGRLKSNCCCIYTRPRRWDDPSTWEQDEHETEHCRGHTLPNPNKDKGTGDKKDSHGHGPGCC